MQAKYNKRVKDLQDQLNKVRKRFVAVEDSDSDRCRYKELERRRKLEVEGFANDIFALRRSLYKLETLYYGSSLSRAGRFKMENTQKDSSHLANEVTALKKRFEDFSKDIEEYTHNE